MRSLAGSVGDLKFANRTATDNAQPGGVVEKGRHVAEELPLRGIVVNGIQAGGWVFDALVAFEKSASNEVLGLADRAAIFEAGRGSLAGLPP